MSYPPAQPPDDLFLPEEDSGDYPELTGVNTGFQQPNDLFLPERQSAMPPASPQFKNSVPQQDPEEAKYYEDYRKKWGGDPLLGYKAEKFLKTPLAPDSNTLAGGHEPDTWWGGFNKGLYDQFIQPLSTPRNLITTALTGKTAMGALGKAESMLPGGVRAAGNIRSITPEMESTLGQSTAQRMQELVDRTQKSNEMIKAESPMLTPEEIQPAQERLNQLMEKASASLQRKEKGVHLTVDELKEGQYLDKKLREVHFGKTSGAPKQDTIPQMTPAEMTPVGGEQSYNETRPQEATPGATEQQQYDLARNKFNMGQENPDLPLQQEVPPQAPVEAPPEGNPLSQLVKKRAAKGTGKPSADVSGMPDMPAGEGKPAVVGGIRQPRKEYPGFKGIIEDEAGAIFPNRPKRPAGSSKLPPGEEPPGAAQPNNKRLASEYSETTLEEPGTKPAPNSVSANTGRGSDGFGVFGGPPPGKSNLIEDFMRDPNTPTIERKTLEPFAKPGMGSEMWNATRSLQSIDLPGVTSAALRQSRPLAFTPDWFRAWGKAAKAFGSKGALDEINSNIGTLPHFKPRYEPVYNKAGELVKYLEKPSIAEEMGVKMTDVLSRREEAIASSLAERIPGYGRYVSASNRAYTAFLNDLRANKFEQLMEGAKALGKNPEMDLTLGKDIAHFVNNATGRGSLGAAEGTKVAELLGNTLYSPRALSARLSFFDPRNYLKADPMVRNEYIKGLARIGVSWGGFTGLGMLMGGKTSFDPTNSDFGKIRFGNTRFDPGAGLAQLLVLGSREYFQGTTSSTGQAGEQGKFTPFGKGPYSDNMISLLLKYARNQLHPSLGAAIDASTATRKNPLDVTDKALQLVVPMFITDIADAAKEDPAVAYFFAPVLSSLGVGAQTYEKKDFGKPKITPYLKNNFGIDLPTTQFYPGQLVGR